MLCGSMSAQVLKEMRKKYPLPVPKASQAEVLAAQKAVASYQLQRVDENTVTGGSSALSHDNMTFEINREAAKHLRALAFDAHRGGKGEQEIFNLYLDYLLSQNFVEMVCGPSFYVDWRTTPANFLSALTVCDADRQHRLMEAIDKILRVDRMMGTDKEELRKHISSDFIYIMLPHQFISALYMPTDEKATERLEQLSYFLSECTHYMPGGGDILKPDGVGFHHGTHYNGYMYCYNTWVEYMSRLAGTPYRVTKDACQRIRKAVMSPYLMATTSPLENSHFCGNSMAGRHPFTGMNLKFSRQLLESLMIVCKDINNGERSTTMSSRQISIKTFPATISMVSINSTTARQAYTVRTTG